MKKLLTILCVGCILGTANYASACEGDVITDKFDSSKQYCRSEYGMPWWTAYQWCEAQGYVLASPESCNYISNNQPRTWQDGYCENLHPWNSKECWLNFINAEKKGLSFAAWSTLAYDSLTNMNYALCKM